MIEQRRFSEAVGGEAGGRPVDLFTLKSDRGGVVRITNFGATVTELHVPDRHGALADVVLGYDAAAQYELGKAYFGAMVGRVANRIARGRFTIDDREYQLTTNDGDHHLHGGLRGLNKVVWEVEAQQTGEGPAVRLRYHSPDGEEGYPGDLEMIVQYTWTPAHELKIEMEATCSEPTPVNLAHHGYWNLDGHASGTVLEHALTLEADHYTPTDGDFIPTGELAPVAGTPFDFREAKPIGRDIARLPPQGPRHPGGYDTNFVVRGEAGTLRPVAKVVAPASGRTMEVLADQAGVQVYSGNFLSAEAGKGGAVYPQHAGLCLETQAFPDAVHHQGDPGWPQVVLRPGEVYRHTMVHRFDAR